MDTTIARQFEAWVNDQLDLYNYAAQIGDKEWQKDIVASLSHKDDYIRERQSEQKKRQLWGQFDKINRSMLRLFEELRMNTTNEKQLEAIRSEMWELKKQRLEVVKRINAAKARQ